MLSPAGIRVLMILAALAAAPGSLPAKALAADTRVEHPEPRDTALFSRVVQAIAREEGRPIRVDPRPLKADDRPGFFVHPDDFAETSGARVRAHTAILARLGIPSFRMFEEDECESGPGGVSPPIPPDTAGMTPLDSATVRDRQRLAAQPVLPTCVLVSLPRPGGEDAGSREGSVTTRTVTLSRERYRVYDVVAVPTAGGWRVVQVVTLDTAWS